MKEGHQDYAAVGRWTGCGVSSVKNWRAAPTSSSRLPARRLAATAVLSKPQMRSAGLAWWAAYLGSQSACTRGCSRSQARTTLAVWIGALSSTKYRGWVG